MRTVIHRSSLPELGWCVNVSPDGNPFHRSWHWFETRKRAREFARESKRKWNAWMAELQTIAARVTP